MAAFKYQHILQAMAERAKVSETPWDVVQRILPNGEWVDLKCVPALYDDSIYRLKPRNGVEAENARLREALKEISSKKGLCIYAITEAYRNGSADAFMECAAIADNALEPPEGE